MKKISVFIGTLFLAILFFSIIASAQKSRPVLSPKEELGKRLFFDTRLSSPEGQACATCHAPQVGMTGPDEKINRFGGVYEGAVHGRFGNRRPPTAAYAGDSPVLHMDADGNFVGGMFWDGRATGETFGDPLAEQALVPFLNPLEHNMPDKKSIILKVRQSDYASLFEKVWGKDSLDAEKDIDGTYERIARSIAAYERSAEVNPFNSKFDDFWRKARAAGLAVESISTANERKFEGLGLSREELGGLLLFNTKGKCANCHLLKSEGGKPPLLADFGYDNLGIPKNPQNPYYEISKEFNPDGKNWLDKGLGGFLGKTPKYAKFAAQNLGKHKTPTLRNVDLRPNPGMVKAYMHNASFKSLKDIVHFYNTRDIVSANWPQPEIKENVNTTDLGNLGLTEDEEEAIVTFMKTLSDRI